MWHRRRAQPQSRAGTWQQSTRQHGQQRPRAGGGQGGVGGRTVGCGSAGAQVCCSQLWCSWVCRAGGRAKEPGWGLRGTRTGGCVGPGLGLGTWWPRSSLKSAVTSGFFTDFFGLDCPPVHPSLCSHLTFPQQTHQSVFHSALLVSVLSSATFCMMLASSGNSSYHLFIFLTASAGFVLRNSRQGWAESSF